ncbi:PRC-barrel domain-containing protein [Microvirga roseola]|uniref:PRC-barrel domain-containing protein n=1 Tax=Microvirga roseola TaxID=2883126 RepID=UPI001E3415CB|nr:PRC-barrel domain-containing protein [Microvirga roseola]
MRMTLTVAGLLCSTLVAPAALAQAAPPPTVDLRPPATVARDTGFAGPDIASGPVGFITRRNPGILRATDVIGQDVYSPENQDVGEVADVLIDRNGRVTAFVIEVGGFLGIGERRLAVPPQAIRLDPYDMTATTGTLPGQGLPPSTAAGVEQRSDHRISRAIVPDRIILTIPTGQLRAAPAYMDE